MGLDYKFKDFIISSIDDLISFNHKLKKWQGLKFFYRGQHDANFKFVSSLERITPSDKKESIVNFENTILDIFKSEVKKHDFGIQWPNDNSLLEWYSLIQHYGGKTRLLDVSHSLEKALYFAISGNKNTNAALYLIQSSKINYHAFGNPIMNIQNYLRYRISNRLDIKNLRRDDWSYEYLYELSNLSFNDLFRHLNGNILLEPKIKNKRIEAQDSCFLFPLNHRLNIFENFEKLFEFEIDYQEKEYLENYIIELKNLELINSEDLCDYVFIKVIIPQRLISDIKLYLHGLDINEKSIYPDSENDTGKKNNMEICCKLAIKNIGKQIEAHKIRYFHSTVTSKEIHKCIDNLLNNNSIEAEKSLFFLYNLDIKYYSEEHLKKLCIIYKRNSHNWIHKAILKIISRKKSIAAEQLFKNMGYSRPDDVIRYFINSGFEKYIDLLASWIFNMKSDYDRVNMPKVLGSVYI